MRETRATSLTVFSATVPEGHCSLRLPALAVVVHSIRRARFVMTRRVVVTGMGIVCPLGNDLESSWRNIVEGRSGAGPITRFDANVSVTLLDITYTVDGGTDYELNDVASNASDFFATLNVGDTVKSRDVEPDGTAEELDLED